MGILYLVSTPIGNLEDITLRALRVLREVSLIAAEDTRHTQRLLRHYDLHTPCIAYHEHNKLARLDEVLTALAQSDVAVVSDAGTPTISDPGAELVRACIAAGFAVTAIPGPSAPIAALIVSGLPTDKFCYTGFLPRRSIERRALLAELSALTVTLVCFEAPHRLQDSLSDVLETLGDRPLAVVKDITKRYERVWRGTVSAALAHFTVHPPRGEFTLVLAGAPPANQQKRHHHRILAPTATPNHPDTALIAARLQERRAQGERGSVAARNVARELGLQKSIVYHIWLELFADTETGAERDGT